MNLMTILVNKQLFSSIALKWEPILHTINL